LNSGNTKYYSKFKATNTNGSAVGRRYVTEVEASTGKSIKTWEEFYDGQGQVIETREIIQSSVGGN